MVRRVAAQNQDHPPSGTFDTHSIPAACPCVSLPVAPVRARWSRISLDFLVHLWTPSLQVTCHTEVVQTPRCATSDSHHHTATVLRRREDHDRAWSSLAFLQKRHIWFASTTPTCLSRASAWRLGRSTLGHVGAFAQCRASSSDHAVGSCYRAMYLLRHGASWCHCARQLLPALLAVRSSISFASSTLCARGQRS